MFNAIFINHFYFGEVRALQSSKGIAIAEYKAKQNKK